MRFIHLFLVGYFVLVVGAVLALWKAGILNHVSGTWVARKAGLTPKEIFNTKPADEVAEYLKTRRAG